MRFRTLLALVSLLAFPVAAGCSTPDDGFTVVTGFYPLRYLADRIAGDHATVSNLTAPGVEPHDLELTSGQAAQVVDADLVVYLEGFQPAVDEHVEQHLTDTSRRFDIAGVRAVQPLLHGDGHGEEERADPHLWLDPVRYAAVAQALATRLGKLDPDNRASYAERAEQVGADLEKLDTAYQDGLADCRRHEFVTSHAAFSYLAARYDLEQVAIAGLSPEEEPTAKRLADIASYSRSHHVKVIFFETLVSPDLARTLADEVGAEARVLDPVEGVKRGSGDDYVSVMRRNLDQLRTALDCS